MRLLHFNDFGKLVLTDFSGKSIPPYAILSHRWDGETEVLFEDLRNDDWKKKKGSRKIEFCAEKAAQDQLHYFWIDTCCIDKWNLRELSKAINSMFLWYKKAKKCYVFLSDVSVSKAIETLHPSAWEESFRASEWFTRGWTLQELIAPVSVEFFSREGQLIGDKVSLKQLVYEITRIPLKALRNSPLDEFTISERMGWASNRKTSEEEDNIYSLLGILSISMTTSYGEGKEKASRRLQIEIEAASSAPATIPFAQNDNFVGRELELAELEANFLGDKPSGTIVIVGPGGTGKSQLALELAHKTRQKNKRCSVFWVDASDMDSLDQGFWNIASKLNIPGKDEEKADVKEMVTHHLNKERAKRSLLIFDNVDNIHLQSTGSSTAQTTNLIDYLPHSTLCSIIFTTTNRDTAERLGSQHIMELGKMPLATAKRMLENHLNPPLSLTEQHEAELLLQELSYLPLAIVQAAAYINSINVDISNSDTRNLTLQDYRIQLVNKRRDSHRIIIEPSQDGLHGAVTQSPVATTLLISLDQICLNNSLAADYLFLAACVDRKDIPVDLLEASSPREREDAIRMLSSYALITRRPAESALDLHQLVHSSLRERLQSQKRLYQWTQNAITQLLRVFPDSDHGSRSKWRRLVPHVKYTLSHRLTEHNGGDGLMLAWKCAKTLHSDGRYNEAEVFFVQVMESRKKKLGVEHPETLSSMAYLASTYRDQGRWEEAEELEVQVMEMSKKVLGANHPDTLTSISNLASTFWNQGRWKEAEQLEVQIVETRQKSLGADHPDTLTSISNLASTYRDQGRWEEAEKLEVKVMETRQKNLGAEHPDTLTSMANLASTYRDQGRWEEAEELEVQVMETSTKVLGADHPDTLTSMANLASTFWSQGKWGIAEELEVQVMETRKKMLGTDHPDTLSSIAGLASTYKSQGRWEEAEELEVQVMETSKKTLGDDHPDTLTSMANLASMYRIQSRWDEAEELGMQAMESRKKNLGADHPDTLASMANMASTYRDQGRWEEAEDLGAQVMGTSMEKLGADHPDTLTSMSNLASTYTNQDRWEAAEGLLVQVLEIREKKMGADHPSTLTSMANLAFTWKGQGRTEKAIHLMSECVERRQHVLGVNHPYVISSIETLADWEAEEVKIGNSDVESQAERRRREYKL